MAKDTKAPVETSDLRRVSLDPSHWHSARWLLRVEALATALIGVAGLIGNFLVAPVGVALSVLGVPLTPTLSYVMLGLAVAAAVAATRRRLALLFCPAVSVCAIALMMAAAVAGAHHAPGPIGLTIAAIVFWAVLFCYNFALGFWLIPDHIEGPAWVPRLRGGRSSPSRSKPPHL